MEEHNTQDARKTMHIYSALCAGFILSFIPVAAAQLISFPLFLFALIGAYFYRWRAEKDGLLANHMGYLIRTYWLSGFLFVVGFIAAGLYLSRKMDAMRLADAITSLQNGHIGLAGDMGLMIVTTLVAFAPSIIYFVYRVGGGLARALKSYRMPDTRRWL